MAAAILAYLADNPDAADSVIGIRQWWLTGRFAALSDTDIVRRLDALAAAGRIKRVRLGDGTDVYSAQPGAHTPRGNRGTSA